MFDLKLYFLGQNFGAERVRFCNTLLSICTIVSIAVPLGVSVSMDWIKLYINRQDVNDKGAVIYYQGGSGI